MTPITVAANTPGTPIPVGASPFGVAVTPDGKTAYVTTTGTNSVTPIEVATNTPGTPIPVGHNPTAITITGAIPVQPTSAQLSVNPSSPAAAGTQETLSATITPSAAAGSVRFKDGSTTLGSPATVTNGSASMTTTFTPGTHSLTAVFTPDNPAAFTSSTSEAVSYVVNAPGATTTRLTVAPTRAFQGLPVFLIANVKPRTAAGTIQFKDGSTALGIPVPVDSGTTFLIAPPLTTGTHSLSAVFTPANPAAFAPSTSAPVALTVNTLFPLFWAH